MGPVAIEELATRANSAEFRDGVADADFARKILEELVRPVVKETTKGSDDAIRAARLSLLEQAGSATMASSKVTEAEEKFGKSLDEMLTLGRFLFYSTTVQSKVGDFEI